MSPTTELKTSHPAGSSGATLVSPSPTRHAAKDKTRQKAIKHTLQAIPENIVFGMPAREFVDSFLPIEDTVTTPFNKKSTGRSVRAGARTSEGLTCNERNMFEFLIEAMSELLEEFTVINTSRNQEVNPTSDVAWTPDVVAYRKSEGAGSSTFAVADFSRADICHDLKEEDFICDLADDATDQERRDHCPIKPCRGAVRELRRLSLGLAELCNRQHRTHLFHVVLTPSSARLVRRDRSGVVISQAIPINNDSSLLEEFYWRYSHASDAMRGHDTTVRRATKEEIALATPYLKDWAPKHGIVHDFHVFDVPLPNDTPSSSSSATCCRQVIAWAPMSELHRDTARATRAYASFDPQSKEVVFLKDSWRTDTEHFAKESDILRELNDKNVEHVPMLLAGDDLPGLHQRTLTQEHSDASWRTGPRHIVPPRVHHRLLEEFLPDNILTFETPRSMLQFVHHILIAHQQAYERCGILHRDISTNNILIRNGREGILGDWDHGIKVDDKDGKKQTEAVVSNATQRVGTFAFMSVRLSQDQSNKNCLQDDLESIVWVVLYTCLMFIPFTTSTPVDLGHLHGSLFDSQNSMVARGQGGCTKRMVLRGGLGTRGLGFPDNTALTEWMKAAFYLFNNLHVHYEDRNLSQRVPKYLTLLEEPCLIQAPPAQLLDHEFMISMTAAALATDEWAENKCSSRLIDPRRSTSRQPMPSVSSQKRPHNETTFEGPRVESPFKPGQALRPPGALIGSQIRDFSAPRQTTRNKRAIAAPQTQTRSSSSKRERQDDDNPFISRKRAKPFEEALLDSGRRITRSMTRDRAPVRTLRSRMAKPKMTRSSDKQTARRYERLL